MGPENAYVALAAVGEAIQRVANRTGFRISPSDATLLDQMLRSLDSPERIALATDGNPAVQRKLEALIERHAQAFAQSDGASFHAPANDASPNPGAAGDAADRN